MLEKRFNFGGEDKITVSDTIVQRLLAGSVAREKKGFSLGVPQGEGKHAVELVPNNSCFVPRKDE